MDKIPTRPRLGSWLVAARPGSEASAQPVLRRLLIPLASVLTLLVAGFAVVLFETQQASLEQASQKVLEDVAAR